MIDPASILRLDGKVALVTGGTRGIGRAIAEACVAAGAAVMVVARKAAELEETATALAAHGPVATFQGSVGDPLVAEAAIGQCIEQLGGIDIIVNNAAINPVFGPLVDADLAAVNKIFDANVTGPLRFVREGWHQRFRERGGGVVLNVVSIGGLRPGPFIGAYNVSKAALTHLTRQLAQELAPMVRVNAVAPGLVKTDFARALWEPNEEATARAHPLGRIGVPDDIASAALFLVSDASAWMTGETIVVDGGASVAAR